MLEQTILSHLLYNEDYARKTIPFLKSEYFHHKSEQVVFDLINSYVEKYNAFPSKETCYIDLSNLPTINEVVFKESQAVLQNLETDQNTKTEWLIDQTEKWCQEKAVYNAIQASIIILGDKTGNLSKGTIPKLLSDALAVSFDTNIGHDFLQDYNLRYDLYTSDAPRIPFDLEYMNRITKGGVLRKTLNVLMAGTGVGKTIFLCHFAAHNLLDGYNVLYITMEMAEERIAERIDANVMNIQLDQLATLSRDNFANRIQNIKKKTKGRLIIKEYPTGGASASHFRSLINELKIKKNFVPDIVYVDYINICLSSRMKMGTNVNSYSYVKSIAEELRGLGVEFNLPVMTATQVNRTGFTTSDPGLENTSESFGLPATADLMVALVTNEELENLGQILVKQLKNRYNNPALNRRFVIGLDKSRMKLFNCEQTAQEGIVDDVAVMDKTTFGQRDDEMFGGKPRIDEEAFKDFR